jgi:glycosyltransferase involved in cell wall biosynthesis
VPANETLKKYLPPHLNAFLGDAAGIYFVVHHQRRSITPATWVVTQRTLAFLRKLKPDVLHVDDADESLRLAIGQPWRLVTPMVLSVHDPEEHSGESNWRNRLSRRLLFRQARRFVLHNAASLPAFCRRYRISPRLARAVPLGVYQMHVAGTRQADSDGGPVVLFFGRMSPYKGLELLYKAAPMVARAVPGVRFIVAGRPTAGYIPPPPPELPRGGKIHTITEYIDSERARSLFESARVVVCPYTDATQSGVVLTSYGFGKPVVATRVGGLPEYVRDGESGLLVAPGDAQALAAALVTVLQDARLRDRLGAGIDELRRGPLSWSNVVDRFVEVYGEVLCCA